METTERPYSFSFADNSRFISASHYKFVKMMFVMLSISDPNSETVKRDAENTGCLRVKGPKKSSACIFFIQLQPLRLDDSTLIVKPWLNDFEDV